MNRLILISILAFTYSYASAQKLERYEGAFANDQHEKATATYSFYKDKKTGKKVKEGSFRYSVRIKSPEKRLNRNISGEYKKGWKQGVWNYSYTTRDYNTNNDGYFYSYNVVLEANYDNGWPEGEWNYTAFVKRRKSIRVDGRVKWDKFEIVKDIHIRLNYNHGVFIDSLWIQNAKGMSVDVLMNNQGFLMGDFKISSDQGQMLYSFKDGFRVEPKVDSSFKNMRYDYYIKHKTKLLENGARLDTNSLFENESCVISNVLNSNVFSNVYFNYHYIDGDRIISFVGSRKLISTVYKGLYMRKLSVVISANEKTLIHLIYGFYSNAKRKTKQCEAQYKSSENDLELRKRMDQSRGIENKLKAYTCQVQAFKKGLSAEEIAIKASLCGVNIETDKGHTRTQLLNSIYNKAKALDAKMKSIKCE